MEAGSEENRHRIIRNALLTLGFLALHVAARLLRSATAGAAGPAWLAGALPILAQIFLALFAIGAIFLAESILEGIVRRKIGNAGVKYNVLRIVRLAGFLLAAIAAASFLFQNLYAAVVSLGLISLIVGFALQAPITSFIAWVHIISRRPFHVGDRIQIGNLRGDVIEISYLETVLKECRGPYFGSDRQSGRTIRMPNSLVLKTEVINYLGPDSPFIWNETAIQIAWHSDLAFVEACLRRAADDDFAAHYPPLPAGVEREISLVYFRNNRNAWLEAVVSYLVRPPDTTARRSRILRAATAMLNKAPDKARLPEGSRR